jgi:hypothetical protein
LCNDVSFLIFFISASSLVSGTSGWWPLLSNGEQNWQFFGMFHSLSSSILSIECLKETFVAIDSVAIFYDSVAVGVIIMKQSSSSVNSRSSLKSSFTISLAMSITSVQSCSGVHIGASWLVVS